MGGTSVVVTCQTCRAELGDSPGLEQRSPCQNCGSTARLVKAGLHDEIRIHEQVAVRAKRGGRGRPFREMKSGDDFHRRSGRWNVLSRLIDREQDRYEERIVDGETGAVIREICEPLSQHRGGGSAKRRSS